MTRLIKNGLLLLSGLALLNGAMYLQQPSMTFFPYPEFGQTPADWGLEYEEVSLETEDGIKLHGWYLPQPASKQVLLFFHGNAGNISHRGDSLEVFHRLGLNVFIFDYRGYGKSQGKPGEAGLYKDARAAWNYLTHEREYNGKDIILFGRSLGGAVAARLAAEVQPGRVILESTFSSAKDMAHSFFPILSRLVLLRYQFNTAAYLKQVKSPVLMLHSPQDEIVPFRLGAKAFQAANQPKFFATMKGGHNGGFLLSQPDYEKTLGDFIFRMKEMSNRQMLPFYRTGKGANLPPDKPYKKARLKRDFFYTIYPI